MFFDKADADSNLWINFVALVLNKGQRTRSISLNYQYDMCFEKRKPRQFFFFAFLMELIAGIIYLSLAVFNSEWQTEMIKIKRSSSSLFRPRPNCASEEFENFSLKTHQMLYIHATLEEFKTTKSPAILDSCKKKKGSEMIWWSWGHQIHKAPFFKCFLSSRKRKAGVFNFSGLKSVFRKIKAPLSWRISVDAIGVERKLRIQICPV